MGEAGRNELPVTADEAAHLLLCPHADGGSQDADADASRCGRRQRYPDWADAGTEGADRGQDLNEESRAAVVLNAAGDDERGADDVWASEGRRDGAGNGG